MSLYAPIRTVIADDHEIFRNGLKLLMKDQKVMELVGEAENGKELMDVIGGCLPEVAIIDIKMPVMDGIEACKTIRRKYPDIRIIALSMFNDDNLIVDMLEAGARGYLLKNTNKQELMTAIQTVFEGNTYYCNATSDKLTKMIANSKFNPYRKYPVKSFTDREIEIIKLLCSEYSNKEIANKLGLSIRTIEGHRDKLYEKIGAKNSIGIAIYAIKNELFRI